MEEKIKSNVLQTLGKNIKQIRLSRGLSQEDLASKLQKSINFVSLLENGKTGLSIQTIIDICRVLEVDTNAIFTNLVTPINANIDTHLIEAFNLFNEDDKRIVTDLISYILNSKS